MQERLARRQVEEELRQLRSRVARLTRDEAKLRDSQEAYRILVDRSLQGLMIIQDQRIVFANQAAADITDHGIDELLTTTLEQAITVIHPDDRAMVRQRHEDRLQGLPASARYAVRAIHKDGSLCWLELQAGVVDYRGRPAIQVALTDITTHQQTALALGESESKLQSIFRATAVGIGLICNRVLREVNDRFCEMIGYRREELLGQNARILYPTQEDYDYVGREKYGQIRERGASAVETRWQRKDGAVIDVLVGSILVDPTDLSKGATFTVLDITERKRADDALRENKAKLETILDSSPCAIAVCDLEGRVVDANDASLTMFGVPSKKEGIGRSLFEFVNPGQWDRARDYMARTLRDGLVRNVEYKLLTNDGSEFIGDVSSSVIRDAAGQPCGFVTVMTDITERKRSETLTRILHDLAVSLGAVGDLQEGLRLCLQAALDTSGLDCGGIYLRGETSGAMDLSCHTGLSAGFVRRVSHYERDTANVQLTLKGEPIYANYAELGLPPNEVETQEDLHAVAIVPLAYRKQIIGCLNVASHSMAEVPQHARITLETIAGQISGTIARLKAEAEVRRERELLGRIADTSPAGITVADREGRLQFANPRAEAILGIAREQITRRTYDAPAWHITDYDGGPFPEEQLPFRQVMTTGRSVHNVRHAIEWPDGRRVLLSVNAAPIADEAGHLKGMVATFDDVTEQVRAEERIKKEKDFSELAINALPGIFYIFDENGKLLRWNKNLEAVTGYSAQEIARHTAFDHVRPDCRELLAQRMREAFSQGKTEIEVVFVSKAGNQTPYYCQAFRTVLEGRPHLIGVGIDITERKRAEESLRVSEERFRRIFEEGSVGMVLTSRDFRFFHANPAFCRMLGYDEKEMNGLTFLDVTHPEHRDTDRQNVERLWRGEIPCYKTEKRYLAKNGDIRWASLSASLIQGPAEKPHHTLGIVEDITERKRAETLAVIQQTLAVKLGAINDLEEGLRSCLQAALDASGLDCGGVYLRDEVSASLDLRCCIGVSDDFAHQVSHYDRDSIPTQLVMKGVPIYATYAELGFPLSDREVREGLRAVAVVPIIHRKRVIGSLNVLSRSLTEVPPYSRSVLETIASQIGGTITRLRAEQALRESEQRFRTLFEAAPDIIYVTDLEGNLVSGNKAAEHLAGIPRDQAIGMNLLRLGLLSEPQIPRAAAHLKASAEGKATGPDEFTFRRRDGVCLTLETRTFPITIGNRTLVLGIARDITERKLAEKEARERHEHLLHISRLGTLGEMASGFAHELNQPLSAILSYASALRRSVEQQTPDPELLRRDLDQVIVQTKRAGEIVKRVRAFVQRRPPLLRPTDINDIVRETLALLHFEMVPREIQVVLDLGASLPRVPADGIQLEQALLNLVRNAIEAMETTAPPKRRLTIRTTAPAPDMVKVTVSDTGVGLHPEVLSRLFDPFFTTKPNGLGVGLSITRSIIELHRGQIGVEPGPEPGCTFAFTLPATLEDPTTSR